jgi:probable F420-dependent oxidoreductase
MRVGVDIPYFASPVEIRDYVQAVEALGFHHVGFSEHICCTLDSAFPAPVFAFDDPWHESFTLASFVAAVTGTIELNPAMVLLPLYPPVLAAKQAAEVDGLSGGRLRVGASIGWNERECESLGVDPATRGARFEEQVEVMRRLWTERAVDHHGRFFQLSQAGISPRPARPIPLWLGAGPLPSGGFPSPIAMGRSARVADGFKFVAPTAADPDRVARTIVELRARVQDEGRDPTTFGIEVRLVSQATAPEQWPGVVERAREVGATHLGLANRIAGGTVDDQIEMCRRFVEATAELW